MPITRRCVLPGGTSSPHSSDWPADNATCAQTRIDVGISATLDMNDNDAQTSELLLVDDTPITFFFWFSLNDIK